MNAQDLNEEKKRLERGKLAPPGAWIETGLISGRPDWRQAYWRAEQPIFSGNKRKYIGKAGSAKHEAAIIAVLNRDRLAEINRILTYSETAPPSPRTGKAGGSYR